jgi:hypothetical protein
MALALCCYCDLVLSFLDYVVTPQKTQRLVVESSEVVSLMENQFGRDLIGEEWISLYTLAVQTGRLGPIHGYACFYFERLFGYLKPRILSASAPEANEASFYRVFSFDLCLERLTFEIP